MIFAKVDGNLPTVLATAKERVYIRGADDRYLGYFHPVSAPPVTVRTGPPTAEELRELQANKEAGMSLADFWKQMGIDPTAPQEYDRG